MDESIILFFVSLVALSALFFLKVSEWRGRTKILMRLSSRFDPFLGAAMEVGTDLALFLRSIAPKIFQFSLWLLRRIFLYIIGALQQRLHRLSELLRGKTARRRGTASFFLKDVANHKHNLMKEQ